MNQNPPGFPMKRRDFLGKTGALAVTAGIGSRLSAFAAVLDSVHPNAAKLGWKVSVQHYTYRNFSVFEAMDMSAAVGLRYFEVRSNLKLGPKWPGKNADEAMPDDARKELKRQNYQGVIAIDFEHDTPALQKDMMKNIAFAEDHARLLL